MSIAHKFPYQLYLVISEKDCKGKDLFSVAEQAILGGVDIIQLREKTDGIETYATKALRLKEITEKYQIPIIINDNLEVAKRIDAAGIHVGSTDISPVEVRKRWSAQKYVGYSIEKMEQLENEQTQVSDYLGISPVFSTLTKTDTITEWGLEGIRKIREKTDKPLVAIGNINLKNARQIKQCGANCIAVVSAICSSDNPQKMSFKLKNEMLK